MKVVQTLSPPNTVGETRDCINIIKAKALILKKSCSFTLVGIPSGSQ